MARGRNGWEWARTCKRIRVRDKGLCQGHKRRGLVRKGDEVHHIVPVSQGGTDHDSNLELLCDECHDHITHKRTIPKGCDANGDPLR